MLMHSFHKNFARGFIHAIRGGRGAIRESCRGKYREARLQKVLQKIPSQLPAASKAEISPGATLALREAAR
jgi:hypothetical protein